jgi:hypothetical protein
VIANIVNGREQFAANPCGKRSLVILEKIVDHKFHKSSAGLEAGLMAGGADERRNRNGNVGVVSHRKPFFRSRKISRQQEIPEGTQVVTKGRKQNEIIGQLC